MVIIRNTKLHLGDALMILAMMQPDDIYAGTPECNALLMNNVRTIPVEHIVHWDVDVSDITYPDWEDYANALDVDWDGRPPKLSVTAEEVEAYKLPETGRMNVGICCWSRDFQRSYPHWKSLVRHLKKHFDVYIFGREHVPIRQLVSHVSQMNKIISVDCGLAHIAGCLGIPLIVIEGPTECREIYGWYGNIRYVKQFSRLWMPDCQASVNCVKCYHANCMYLIHPNEIIRCAFHIKNIVLDLHTDNETRGLGDVIMSTVVARALSETFKLPIIYVVRPLAEPLLEGHYKTVNNIKDIQKINNSIYIPFRDAFEHYRYIRNRRHRIDSMLLYCGVKSIDKKPAVPKVVTFRRYAKPGKINVGVGITSMAPTRSWPIEYLHELAKLLGDNYLFHLFEGARLHKQGNIIEHKTSLSELIGAISQMNMVLSVDSLLSHLAGALNIPSVVLYTTIKADWRNKYYNNTIGIQSPVDCSPCMDRQFGIPQECEKATIKPCVQMLTPEMIAEVISSQIRERNAIK